MLLVNWFVLVSSKFEINDARDNLWWEHQGSKAQNIIQYVQLQVNKLGKKTVGPLTVPYNNEYNF